MFTPSINLDILTKATQLRFSDRTGADTGDGTKWDGVAGIASSDVSAALITVTDPEAASHIISCTAAIAAASPVITGEDIIFPVHDGEWKDGYYSVVYDIYMVLDQYTAVVDYSGTVAGTIKIVAAGHAVQTGMKVLMAGTLYTGSYSAVRIDANNFYITETFTGDEAGDFTPFYSNTFAPFVYANIEMALERMYAVFAAMDEGQEADEYLRHCEMVMGLYHSLKYAIATASTAIVNNIYGRILRILDFYSIELNY